MNPWASGETPPQESPARLTRPLAAKPVLDIVGLVGKEFNEFVLILLGDALTLQQEPPADQTSTTQGQATPTEPGGAQSHACAHPPQPRSSLLPSSPGKDQGRGQQLLVGPAHP